MLSLGGRWSMAILTERELCHQFSSMGLVQGDTVLVRAGIRSVGEIEGGVNAFIGALLKCVGEEGTVVSLSFTESSFIRKPKPENAFHIKKRSYAGALPNAMLEYPGAVRSQHPTCSYVAIGKQAQYITQDHDYRSPAYEPIRKVIELKGKCMLVGCVGSSPGFTTTHLAEADLGLLSLAVFPKLHSTYFINDDGKAQLFRRPDPGLCSNSFYKFYALYVRNGVLISGRVGDAYSIVAPAQDCYEIDLEALSKNPKFNLCDSKYCFTCNAGRWDRIHRAPAFLVRKLLSKSRRVQRA